MITFIRPHLIDADRQTVFFAETAHINTFEGLGALIGNLLSHRHRQPKLSMRVQCGTNLVPRVFWLFGQRGPAPQKARRLWVRDFCGSILHNHR